MRSSREWLRCSREWMRSSRAWMRSNREWMRSSRENRASDCQFRSRNSPGFVPSILRHSVIWAAADEAVLNIIHRGKKSKNTLLESRCRSHIKLKPVLPICALMAFLNISALLFRYRSQILRPVPLELLTPPVANIGTISGCWHLNGNLKEKIIHI
jgi:hypothetical protein